MTLAPINLAVADINISFVVNDKKWRNQIKKSFASFLSRPDNIDLQIKVSPEKRLSRYRLGKYGSSRTGIINTPIKPDNFGEFNYNFKLLFSRIALEKKMLLLHASSLLINGRVHVFIGPKGAGKSTITKLADGYLATSDDSILVGSENEEVYAYTTPFVEKEKSFYEPRKNPVSAVYAIHRSKKNKIVKVNKKDALRLWLKNTYLFSYENSAASTLTDYFGLCYDVCQEVPTYKLYFKKSQEFIRWLK